MPISDEQVVKDRLDLEMLERPRLWSAVNAEGDPVIFLRRGTQKRQTGPCMLRDGTYIVLAHHWDEDKKLETLTYDSAEAVLRDGWVVD